MIGAESQVLPIRLPITKRLSVSLYPIEDKIYVNWLSGVSADKSLYYIEQIDISTDKVSRLCDMNEKYPEISSTIINWNSETYFDKDGNLYFTCVDKDNYMVLFIRSEDTRLNSSH